MVTSRKNGEGVPSPVAMSPNAHVAAPASIPARTIARTEVLQYMFFRALISLRLLNLEPVLSRADIKCIISWLLLAGCNSGNSLDIGPIFPHRLAAFGKGGVLQA